MNKSENMMSLVKRTGYEKAIPYFELCEGLEKKMKAVCGDVDYRDYFGFSHREVMPVIGVSDKEKQMSFHKNVKPNATIDQWGVVQQKGSDESSHLVQFLHPLEGVDDLETIENYPFPDYSNINVDDFKKDVEAIKARGLVAVGRMGCTIWERAWMIRGMEDIMADMICDADLANAILDKIFEDSLFRAKTYVAAGVDILWVGDDIGMQHSIMMSEEMYREFIKPRIKEILRVAKEMNPNLKVMYHSCGYILPFIPDLIEIGVDILNPIQPESMDFQEIYEKYGDKLTFHGTLGTQTLFPFGTIEDIKNQVKKNLDLVGSKGGLICCPTHMLEADVEIEKILAYVEACNEYQPK